MAKSNWQCPNDWSEWSEWLAAGFARTKPLATAGAADGHSLRPRASHRDHLAPRRRHPRRLHRLFLLPRQPRTQDRIGRCAAFSAPAADLALARPAAGGHRRGRGRPRKYGKNKISLAKRAGQKQGWQTAVCLVYGKLVTKTFKTFLATYRPAGGVIRVVLVKEEHGWFAFFCTDPTASVVEILKTFADRATIEQDFHDIKEVWGAGQQQVRNIWSNVAVYHLGVTGLPR